MNSWQRDFPAERTSKWGKLLHNWRGGKTKKVTTFDRILGKALDIRDRQAQFVDTNFYYRVGGTDPQKAKDHNDILAIQYGIGSRVVDTFAEQVGIANDQGLPYFSWIIYDPDDNLSIADQAEKYVSHPLAKVAPLFTDLEKPRSYTRMINYDELKIITDIHRQANDFRHGCYSRVNLFESVFPNGFPDWFEDVVQWIAQYLLYWNGSNWVQYRYYENFLDDWEWSLPPSVTKSRLYSDQKWRDLVWMWQFTDKGDAEYYIANEFYAPGKPGMKNCDLNVSMQNAVEFITKLFGEIVPPPTPGECPEDCKELIQQNTDRINQLESNLVTLEQATEDRFAVAYASIVDVQKQLDEHEHEGTTPPETDYLTVKVDNPDNANCSVYLPVGHDKACEDEPEDYDGPPGKPIPENKIGRFEHGTEFKIYKSGWYSCIDKENTPEIKTGYGDHYLVYGGAWDRAMVPAKRVRIL